jgi:hypothetical protein
MGGNAKQQVWSKKKESKYVSGLIAWLFIPERHMAKPKLKNGLQQRVRAMTVTEYTRSSCSGSASYFTCSGQQHYI